jgi:hypothetical protein
MPGQLRRRWSRIAGRLTSEDRVDAALAVFMALVSTVETLAETIVLESAFWVDLPKEWASSSACWSAPTPSPLTARSGRSSATSSRWPGSHAAAAWFPLD